MNDEKEIVRRALDFQARARDYSLRAIPAYMKWSERRLDDGVSEALIAHLDATSIRLLPEEVSSVSEETFDEMLEDLKSAVGDET